MSVAPGAVSSPPPGVSNEPWLSEGLPFNCTAAGYLGVHRQGMLANPLLKRARLGRSTSFTSSETYGNSYRCPLTVGHVLSGNVGVSQKSKELTRRKTVSGKNVDYLGLNRGAIFAGLLTAPDVFDFRKQKVRLEKKVSIQGIKLQERPEPNVFKPETVFGKPNRYESIADLTSNLYHREWLMGCQEGSLQKSVKRDIFKVRPNRASMVRPVVISPGIERLPWRNPYVLVKAQPSISTFRTHQDRHNSLAALAQESQNRLGMAGQGILKTTVHEHQAPPLPKKCPRC